MIAIKYLWGVGVLATAISTFGVLLISSNTGGASIAKRVLDTEPFDSNRHIQKHRDPSATREHATLVARVNALEDRLDSSGSWTTTSSDSGVPEEITRLRAEVEYLSRIINGLESHRNTQIAEFLTDESNHYRYSDNKSENTIWQEYESDEAYFYTQDYESQWSAQVADTLQRRLNDGDDLPEGAPNVITAEILNRMECRATTCRLELWTSEDQEAIQEQFMLQSGHLFADITTHYNDTGDAIIFFHNE